VLLLGVLLAVVTGLLVWQSLRADALAGQVGVLRAELAGAREDIRRNELRMGAVRQQVDDLSDRIGALRTLVTDE
jgi:hypothetical protein